MASVPDDCSVVVVAGPQKPYVDSELNALGTYLDSGGRAAFLLPPRGGNEFLPLLNKWGVKLGNDVVVDQVVRLFEGPALGLAPLVNTYGAHEITRDFKQFVSYLVALMGGPPYKKYVFFLRARPGTTDRKSTRLNSSHIQKSRMPSSA